MAESHELYLVTFYEKRSELEDVEHLRPFFRSIELVYLPKWRSVLHSFMGLFSRRPLQVAYFSSARMRKMVRFSVEHYNVDVVHTQHLRMSQYTRDLDVPRILDLPDAFSLYFKRRKETDRPWIHRMVDRIEIGRLVNAEKVVKEFDKTLVCSAEDKAYLEKLHNTHNIDLLLNGVDLETFDVKEGHDYTHKHTVLFTGNMDYAPNVDAVQYFVREMWPALRERHPETRFVIAGQRPVDAVKRLEENGVEVTGFVPDLSDMYAQASVVVAPLRFGAGTQNKVLEAMAMGVPVVCTHIGFEGLQVKSGEGVIMAREKSRFIEEVDQLLSDQEMRRKVGEQGLSIARNRFSWDIISKQLATYFEEVAALDRRK